MGLHVIPKCRETIEICTQKNSGRFAKCPSQRPTGTSRKRGPFPESRRQHVAIAWVADARGSIFSYNRRWFEYTGTTFDDMHGWRWQKVHHPDHVQKSCRTCPHTVLSGLKLLVVDDDPDVCGLIEVILSSAEIWSVTAAKEGLRWLENNRPHLMIFDDIAMPDEDGYSLLAQERWRRIFAPAIALTAHAR
jgi:hypothetical protein